MIDVAERTLGRSLVPPELFTRVVGTVLVENNVSVDLAERVVDQALAFLGACARDHDAALAPSALVDIGWHAFILHTKHYASFCERVAGRFLHHTPAEEGGSMSDPSASMMQARTVAAIEAAGFSVEPELWPSGAIGNCTGCHNGCHDDPPPRHR